MLGTGDPFLTEGHALFSNTQTWSDVQLANNQETLKCDKQTCGDSAEEQLHDSGLETEIKSSSDDDIEMHFEQGGVHDICPPSGSVKGGLKFQINLKENLPEHVKSGIGCFDGIGDVELDVTNPYSFSGITLASPKCGPVPVTIQTRDGHQLGMTQFVYVDKVQEVLNQLIKEPALRSSYPDHMQALVKEMVRDLDLQLSLIIAMSCQEDESDSYVAQNPEAKLAQVQVKVLQLLVYVAAEEDAEQFLQMIFSTSAGKMVFDSYKAETTLPEDVARANGHNELAEYLQDVNKRLSKGNGIDVHSKSVDWQELIQAVKRIQTQSSMFEDEQNLRGMSSDEDFFPDADTSCGSVDGDSERSDSKGTFTIGEEPTEKEASSLAPPVEPSSEETAQFDQAKGKEKKRFWFYALYMFVLFSDTLLMCISIFLRILTGFMLEILGYLRVIAALLGTLHYKRKACIVYLAETFLSIIDGHTRRVLYRRVIPYCTQNWDRVAMCTIMLLSLLAGFMPEGWRPFIVAIVLSFFLSFFLKRSLDAGYSAYLSASDAVEEKFKNLAVTVQYILYERFNSDEAELDTCDPRPPIWPKRRRYPRLSALDASGNEGPFSNYLIDNTGRKKKLKNLPETLPSITRYESDSSDETECDTCDLLPPMRPKKRRYPSLSALDARRKSNPKVFDG